jgi:hypothetical protein
MKKAVKILIAIAVLAAILAGGVRWLWSVRTTEEQTKETSKTVRREFRKAPLDEAAARLRKLRDEHFFTVRFPGKFPYLSMGFEPRVPYDFIGLLAEEAFIRLAGDTKSPKDDTERRIKEMIGVASELLKSGALSATARDSLRERRLDGYFLVGDYDSAIAEMENGLPGHTAAWSASTAAKLRAHKAMAAKNNKDAIIHLLAFIKFMLSDEQKDFEDCDPTTGIFYSREWVVARNYMRCANMAAEMKDDAKAAEYKELAKKNFTIALKKAKDDTKSLPVLKEEAKSVGL